MKTFDELRAMTEEERAAYLESEVEQIIQRARPNQQLKLRALHSKCRGISKRVKHPLAAASQIQSLMLDKALELEELLKCFRGIK